MELELKKDKEGANICTLKDGRDVGASLNLDRLFERLGHDFTDLRFEYGLVILGLRHAISGLEVAAQSEDRMEELFEDLYLIENIIDSFNQSISRSDLYQNFRQTEEFYKTDLLAAKKDLKESLEALNEARNACANYVDKNMKLEHENAELKARINQLNEKK